MPWDILTARNTIVNPQTPISRRTTGLLTLLALATAFGCGLLAGPGVRSSITPQPVQAANPDQPDDAPRPLPEVIRAISPAIVSVGAVKRTYLYDPHAEFFAPFFRRPRAYRQERTPFMGSGFLIDRDGHILTNFHVIEESEEVFVTFTDGRELPARVLDADRFSDVALLKIDAKPEELPTPLELGDSDALAIGQTALAIGNPFGNLIEDPRPTVTRGVVSALHRTFRPDRQNLRVYQDMIQTDAAINPGNSGGPLVDAHGRAIGINTFIVSRTGGSIGLGFAIPINRAKVFVDEVRQYGRLRPLVMDFNIMTLRTPRVNGVIVSEVRPGGPAERARLEVGDIITAVDNRSVATREEFILLMASSQVGQKIQLTVWRSGEERSTIYEITADTSEPPARK